MSAEDKQRTLNRFVGALARAPDVRSIWLVGSAARNNESRSLDLLVGYSSGEPESLFTSTQTSLLPLHLDNVPKRNDDILTCTDDGWLIGIAPQPLAMIKDQVTEYLAGHSLEGRRTHWSAGYWLPEAYLGDIATAVALYDPWTLTPAITSKLIPYPEQLARAIVNHCRQEVESKLCTAERCSTEDTVRTIEYDLALADTAAAVTRLAFAVSRRYLRGFHRLDEQCTLLTHQGQRLYLIAQLAVSAEPAGSLLPKIRSEIRDALPNS